MYVKENLELVRSKKEVGKASPPHYVKLVQCGARTKTLSTFANHEGEHVKGHDPG